MSEEVAAPVVESGAVGGAAVKKQPLSKVRKTKTTKVAKSGAGAVLSAHPPTKQMVDAAIKSLKERGGSSLPAIKKYIGATYKCDAQKLAPFIKKYLKSAVASGKLIQTKGKGASGSFKLSVRAKQTSANPKAADKPKKEKVKKAKSTTSTGSTPRKTKAKGAGVGAKMVKSGKKAPGRKPASLSSPAKTAATAKSSTSASSVAAEKKAKAAKTTKALKGVKAGGVVKAKATKAAAATKPKAPKAKSAAAVKSKKVGAAATGAASKKALSAAGKK